MTVVFTRTAIPASGRLGEAAEFAKKRIAALQKAYGIEVSLNSRFGGPAGQLTMVSFHDSMSDLEDLRRKIIADVGAGKIPTPEPGLFTQSEDAIWLRM